MKQYLCFFLIMVCLTSCSRQKISSDKVFSNAQILYQDKDENQRSKKGALEKPSYFIDLEYDPQQTKLNAAQINKIEKIFPKLVYPEEYRLYASFGANTEGTHMKSLSRVFKRAQDLKSRYGKRVKEIKIVYLKNQKPNCVYLRLLG